MSSGLQAQLLWQRLSCFERQSRAKALIAFLCRIDSTVTTEDVVSETDSGLMDSFVFHLIQVISEPIRCSSLHAYTSQVTLTWLWGPSLVLSREKFSPFPEFVKKGQSSPFCSPRLGGVALWHGKFAPISKILCKRKHIHPSSNPDSLASITIKLRHCFSQFQV